MKKYCFLSILFSAFTIAYSQELNLEALRQSVVQNNGQLLAQKFEIGAARAQVIQAKLIPNPTLSVSEINLWKNRTAESLAPIVGHFGQHQQISVELEQTIELAGKRKKRVSLSELNVKDAELAYEELLRELQLEIDQSYWNFFTIQKKVVLIESLTDIYHKLYRSYKRQYELQNISHADYLRIQSAFFNLQKDQTALIADRNEWLEKMRVLTHINDLQVHHIKEPAIQQQLSRNIPSGLESLVFDQNISLQKQLNQTKIETQNWIMEKAEKTPNMSLSMNYDRGGNIMQNFVGLGLSMDIPVFNRNKGNIESAKMTIERSKTQNKIMQHKLQNELITLYDQLILYENTLTESLTNGPNEDQLMLLSNYQKNLLSKQITVLEFTDFVSAYQESQIGQMELMLAYQLTYAQLEYLFGENFKSI